MVAETRNHLIAAQQNISSAHGNIKPVNIPYLTDVDLKVSFAMSVIELGPKSFYVCLSIFS